MKRYTFKAYVSTLDQMLSITQNLQDLGISKSDINFAYIPQSQQKGFHFRKKNRSLQVAQMGVALGALLGFIASLSSASKISINIGSLTVDGLIARLIFFEVFFIFIAAGVGYAFGMKSKYNEIIYDEKVTEQAEPRVILAVNTSWQDREKVEKAISQAPISDLEVIDNKFESEVGII